MLIILHLAALVPVVWHHCSRKVEGTASSTRHHLDIVWIPGIFVRYANLQSRNLNVASGCARGKRAYQRIDVLGTYHRLVTLNVDVEIIARTGHQASVDYFKNTV